jgi:selenide,water dikinase
MMTEIRLAVTVFASDRYIVNSTAKEGDILFLTKPLGIGILTTAQKAGNLSEKGEKIGRHPDDHAQQKCAGCNGALRVHACTDVKGFPCGPRAGMARGSVVTLKTMFGCNSNPSPCPGRNGNTSGRYLPKPEFWSALLTASMSKQKFRRIVRPSDIRGLLISVEPKDADALFKNQNAVLFCTGSGVCGQRERGHRTASL